MKIRSIILTGVFSALSLSALAPAHAEDEIEQMEDGGERCIDTRRISTTKVVDAQTILFHMRGGVIYRNTLPIKCSALAREKRFSYRTSISRLCDVDVVTVLTNMGGGLSSGPSCGLGKFYPITKEEAKALRLGPDAEIEPEAIDPADPEQPEVPVPGAEVEE